MPPTANSKPRRRTQDERRAETRGALLDATIEALVKYGYAATTTARISELAGVSRGGQVHHYPTKADLVSDVVSHLAERRAQRLQAAAKKLPGGRDRVAAALDLLWQANTGPLAEAQLELWVAARTDPDLRATLVPVEREIIDQTLAYSRALFGEHAQQPDFELNLALALGAIQGYSLISTLLTSSRRDRTASWERRRDALAKLFT
jgi:AcrR family transcriptional regulator